MDIGTKELTFEATYIAFSRVRRLKDIPIEASFAKDRLHQIRRMEVLVDKLAFQSYPRLLTTE